MIIAQGFEDLEVILVICSSTAYFNIRQVFASYLLGNIIIIKLLLGSMYCLFDINTTGD